MNRLKRALARAIILPPWFILTVSIPSFALLIYVFYSGSTRTTVACVSYAASAYAFTVLCAAIPRAVSAFRSCFSDAEFLRRAMAVPSVQKFLADVMYRAEVTLYGGLAVNLLYAAVKLVSGIAFNSLWFMALSGYYWLLAMMRFTLLRHVRRSPAGKNLGSEWRRYRLCGGELLLMNHALGVVVLLVVRRNSGFVYPGMIIYVMSAYTFYAVVNAIRNMVRFKRHGSPVMSAAKLLNLVSALVSLLSLETAMLTRFGIAGDAVIRRMITGSTGCAVWLLVMGMAIYMIAHSTKQLRLLRQEQSAQ